MSYTLTNEALSSEEEPLAAAAERGWHAVAFDVPAETNDFHWHEFEATTYVVSGTLRVEFEDGGIVECGAGALVEAPAGTVHREVSPAYRAVFAFDRDPAEMTQPVNKPLDEHPGRAAV